MTTTAVWNELLDVTQNILQALGLTWTPPGGDTALDLSADQVYIREIESDLNVLLPNLQVVLGGVEEEDGGDFEDTEVVYPVKIIHSFVADQSLGLNRDRIVWRQLILDAFEHQARPEVLTADVNDCTVTFNPPIEQSQFSRENLQVGGLLLKFRTVRDRRRNARGI